MKRDSDVMNTKEAAAFLRAHIETLRRLARRGHIPSFKVGKDWRFRKDALLRWSEERRPQNQNSLVLIVDDDEEVCRVLSRILEQAGYRTQYAQNGAEGLDMVSRSSTPPGVILLDLVMPGMDGPEFLKQLRETHPDLPVVIVTGYPDSGLMYHALRYSPLLVLPKPVGSRELLGSVRLALGASQSCEVCPHSIRGNQDRFKAFFLNAPEYCYIISPDGKILDVNAAALRALGYRKEEIAGKPLKTIYAPECLPAMERLFAEWRREGHIKNEEMVIISKTGEKRTVLLSASAVTDEDGAVLHSISIQRDITDRRRSERTRHTR